MKVQLLFLLNIDNFIEVLFYMNNLSSHFEITEGALCVIFEVKKKEVLIVMVLRIKLSVLWNSHGLNINERALFQLLSTAYVLELSPERTKKIKTSARNSTHFIWLPSYLLSLCLCILCDLYYSLYFFLFLFILIFFYLSLSMRLFVVFCVLLKAF